MFAMVSNMFSMSQRMRTGSKNNSKKRFNDDSESIRETVDMGAREF